MIDKEQHKFDAKTPVNERESSFDAMFSMSFEALKVDYNNVQKEHHAAIRQSITRGQQLEMLFIVLFLIISISIMSWKFWPEQTKILTSKVSEQEVYETEYHTYIRYGDAWLGLQKWQPAITMYKKAIVLYPNAYDGNHRLALAYSHTCKIQSFNCDLGIAIIRQLQKSYPENAEELKKLETVFMAYSASPVTIN